MIDFQNASFVKLSPIDPETLIGDLGPLLIPQEQVFMSFKGMRDSVTFTNKRLIALNVQGITGKKRDYTSMPYSKIQAFSVETAGTFDLDAELELWFSGLGRAWGRGSLDQLHFP
jgi:PH (Pleckstrin Homology) domain-containing protein